MGEIIALLPQWGGLGAVVAAIIWAMTQVMTKYWDHKPAWSKALLEQQESLTKRLDSMQERIDVLENEKAVREAAFARLRAKLYGMVSRVNLLEGLLRANGIEVPEYPSDDLLEEFDYEWPVRRTGELPEQTPETQ